LRDLKRSLSSNYILESLNREKEADRKIAFKYGIITDFGHAG